MEQKTPTQSMDIFETVFNKINNNPLNSKKFFFEITEGSEISVLMGNKEVPRIEINFGVSKEKSIRVTETGGRDIDEARNRAYLHLLQFIFENMYDRIDEQKTTNQ